MWYAVILMIGVLFGAILMSLEVTDEDGDDEE